MQSNINLRGAGVALVTPFTANGSIDFESLGRLLNHVADGGIDYLVVMGTTAENATLNFQERQAVLDYVVANNKKSLPVVFGIGGNNTAEVVASFSKYNLAGVSAILSVTPYYNKPNQAGLYAHYAAVVEASPLPVILYNVPGRTGVNMTAQTTLRLANDFKGKVIAIKEASGNLSQAAYILRDRPEGFFFISGDDNLTLPLCAMGGDGTISVSANAFAEKFCTMIHAALDNRSAEAAALNLELHEATDMLFEEGNPVGVKAALTIKGIMDNNLRLPLVSSSEALYKKLEEQIARYGL